MAEKLFTVFLGTGMFDDDYEFYSDGTVLRKYDRNIYQFNLEEVLKAEEIEDSRKMRLLQKCPDNKKDVLRELLYPSRV